MISCRTNTDVLISQITRRFSLPTGQPAQFGQNTTSRFGQARSRGDIFNINWKVMSIFGYKMYQKYIRHVKYSGHCGPAHGMKNRMKSQISPIRQRLNPRIPNRYSDKPDFSGLLSGPGATRLNRLFGIESRCDWIANGHDHRLSQ